MVFNGRNFYHTSSPSPDTYLHTPQLALILVVSALVLFFIIIILVPICISFYDIIPATEMEVFGTISLETVLLSELIRASTLRRRQRRQQRRREEGRLLEPVEVIVMALLSAREGWSWI